MANELLRDAALRQLAVFVPGPISGRLDALVRTVDEHGERTSRRELLAALLLSLPEPARLQRCLERLEEASVRDAVVAAQPPKLVLDWRRPPGPRQLRLIDVPQTAPARPPNLADALEALPTIRIGIALPWPVKARLDALAEGTADLETARDDLVAAMILEAPEEPDRLSELLRAFRRTTVDEARQRLGVLADEPSLESTGRRRRRTTRREYGPSQP